MQYVSTGYKGLENIIKKISEEEDDPPGTDSRQIPKLDDLTQTI